MTPNTFTTTPVLDLSPPEAKLASAETSIMSCPGSASMHIPNMIVLHKSFQQPTSNLRASLGCFVWTLAAIATTHAMS
eukprot:12904124-Prorocentrum_lima.AAC.1